MRIPLALASAAALMVCACASDPSPQEPQQPQPQPQVQQPAARASIGTWGYDLASRDTQVKPGDDFYRYALGGWLDSTTIPPDRSTWGAFAELASQAEVQVRDIIEALPASQPASSPQQKVIDYYRSYLDVEAIERRGLEPAQPVLQAIANAKSHEEIAALMGRPDIPAKTPIGFAIALDQKNPDRYVVTVTQSGLGLPDREYYLKDDAAFADTRAKYLAHVERMLALADQKDAAKQAKSIVALETEIARLHWPRAKRRERDLTYNVRSLEQLTARSGDFPWKAFLEPAGIADRPDFVVREVDAVEALGKQFASVPVATWRSYLTYHYLAAFADVLPQAFDKERFELYDRTLNGQPEIKERWKRSVDAVGAALGEAVGQLYVEKHFPPSSKEKMTELVENLRRAYGQRIRDLPWMSQATKTVALEKLATFRPKIGYPDKWRDYSALEIRAGDAFGNATRAQVFEWERRLKRIDQRTDRDEWGMTPQRVNAYYNSTFNEIVFPAAILQPPFFDPRADDAVNYGAIGGVIGHEMGHGFDDQGSKSDAQGILRTWWQPADESAFKGLVTKLATQYDQYEALPGLNLNGRLTLGENIGDLGGLSVALEAYRISLGGRSAPVLDGLTGEQRFFLGWAQAFRNLTREARLRNQVVSDPHSPPKFRVNGVVRNMDAWYDAFQVAPSDKLYLAPDDRVRIW
jgi:putative endopeptidase